MDSYSWTTYVTCGIWPNEIVPCISWVKAQCVPWPMSLRLSQESELSTPVAPKLHTWLKHLCGVRRSNIFPKLNPDNVTPTGRCIIVHSEGVRGFSQRESTSNSSGCRSTCNLPAVSGDVSCKALRHGTCSSSTGRPHKVENEWSADCTRSRGRVCFRAALQY